MQTANNSIQQPYSSWPSIALLLVSRALRRPLARLRPNIEAVERKTVVYGSFKGMGDLLCAAPVIASELNSGVTVILLLFPQLRHFPDLLDFGPNRARLQVVYLPVSGRPGDVRRFMREMSHLTPDLVWYSPHSPRVISSWKIPLLVWISRQRYWPNAKLACAISERCSWLFDIRLPVDRSLPFRLREWTGYSMLDAGPSQRVPPQIGFNEEIAAARARPPDYDLVIHPGATAGNRKWPPKNYAELVKRLPAQVRIVVAGLPTDLEAMRAVLPATRKIDYFSGTLQDVIALMARARLALTMDSGTMFFATTLGVPAVTLFGPTNPAKELDADADIVRIQGPKHPCQPCESRHCSQSSVLCMESITPEAVAAALVARLDRRRLEEAGND